MHQNERTKLCPNCDGSITFDASICPFCGSSIIQKNDYQINPEEDVKSLSPEETLQSLYPPPYRTKAIDASVKEKEIEEETQEEEEEIQENRSALLPTILFWMGINILVFSIILFIFSEDGALHLKWSSKFWFLYLIFSFPLLYLGYRGLKDVD